MRSTLFSFAFVGLLSSMASAEPQRLSNGSLEVSTGEGEAPISQIIEKSRDFHQLRVAETAGGAGLFEDEASEEGGLQIAFHRKGGEGPEWLKWRRVSHSEEERTVRFTSSEGDLELLVALPERGSYLDISLSGTTPESWERLDFSWLLEVAGDFLGVPTESPSDTLVIPVKDGGILVKPIAHHTDESFAPVANWWAVVDRIKGFSLAFEVREGSDFELLQWSGKIGVLDALRQTIRFPLSPGQPLGLKLRLMFLPSADHLSAVGEGVAFSLVAHPQHPARSVLFIMAGKPIQDASFTVRSVSEDAKDILSQKIETLSPERPLRVELPEPAGKAVKLEWQEGGTTQQITLMRE